MRNYVRSFIGLVSLGTTGACGLHELPHKPAADRMISGGRHAGVDRDRANNMNSDRFLVFWTIDYGYRLNPENDMDTIIVPEFESEDALKRFDEFFSSENIGQLIGKRSYCDCVGEQYERNGAIFYKIHEARLFAK